MQGIEIEYEGVYTKHRTERNRRGLLSVSDALSAVEALH